MISSVVDLLHCPLCTAAVAVQDGSVRCRSGHNFDIARQGYVNLLSRSPKGVNADTAGMIAARDRFLAAGHYQPLADRLTALARGVAPDGAAVVEAGAGTGYYLGRVITSIAAARGVAADLSVAAARRAARAGDRVGAIVADTWAGLPVPDRVLDLIMVVFAPRNPADFARMLRPGGRLLIASAGDDHLSEVRDRLGMIDIRPGKLDALKESLRDWFDPEHGEQFRTRLTLDRQALTDLVLMGPTAHHQRGDLADRVAALPDPTSATLSVDLSVFRRR